MPDPLKKCPLCAEMIPLLAQSCPHCSTAFQVSATGYCTRCHAPVSAALDGKCLTCGCDVVDLQVTTALLPSAPAPAPVPVPPPSPQSQVLEIFDRRGEGVSLRFGTFFCDFIILMLLYSLVLLALLLVTGGLQQVTEVQVWSDLLTGIGLFLFPVLWILYFALQEGLWGTTVGKVVGAFPMSLRVIRVKGGRIGLGRALLRALVGLFENNLIGAIVVAATPLKQRLGDLLAGTLVVDKTKIKRAGFLPGRVAIEFVDGRQVELVQVKKARITKWLGIPQWMIVNGVDHRGRSVRIIGKVIRGATVFNAEPKMDQLRKGLENTFNIQFKEVLEWWRIVLLLAIVIPLCAFLAILLSSGILSSLGGS